MFVGMGACRGVYVWCGFANVVPGEAVHCMYVCVCAFHLLRVVGVTYVICGCAHIEHAHASVPHECPKVLCACESICAYVQYVVFVSACELLCLYMSYCCM